MMIKLMIIEIGEYIVTKIYSPINIQKSVRRNYSPYTFFNSVFLLKLFYSSFAFVDLSRTWIYRHDVPIF